MGEVQGKGEGFRPAGKPSQRVLRIGRRGGGGALVLSSNWQTPQSEGQRRGARGLHSSKKNVGDRQGVRGEVESPQRIDTPRVHELPRGGETP